MFDVERTLYQDKAKLQQIVDQRPYQFFVPTRSGFDIIRSIGTEVPEKRIFLVTSANGVGKTTTAANIFFSVMFGNQNIFRNITDVQTGEVIPGFFDFPFYNQYPKGWPKAAWYVTNRDAADVIWEQKFKRWFPSNLYRAGKAGKTYTSSIVFPAAKWNLYFKTIDQEESSYQTADIGIIIFDEVPPRNIFMSCVSRLRAGGIMVIMATPLLEAAWFVDDIIDKIDEEPKDKKHITVEVWDNCIEEGGMWNLGGKFGIQPKGNLWKANLDFQISNYDIDEKDARVTGKFMHLSGLVYKIFNEKKHVFPVPIIYAPFNYAYRFLIDPHERRPPFAMWIRYGKDNKWRIFREWPSVDDEMYQKRMFHNIKNSDPYVTKDFVAEFVRVEQEYDIPNDRILQSIMDPNSGRKPERVVGILTKDVYENEFEDAGRPRSFITSSNDDLYDGHKFVKSLLSTARLDPNLPKDEYPFLVDPCCKNILWSFRNYKYAPITGKAQQKMSISVKVLEIGKDPMDLIRYAAVMPFEYIPPDPNAYYAPKADYDDEEEVGADEFHKKDGAEFV
jgi:phage terminase large subunit-like protein